MTDKTDETSANQPTAQDTQAMLEQLQNHDGLVREVLSTALARIDLLQAVTLAALEHGRGDLQWQSVASQRIREAADTYLPVNLNPVYESEFRALQSKLLSTLGVSNPELMQ